MNPRNVGQASACHARNVGKASACHAPHVGQASACHAPRGFTLVELLVVIGIIGLLAAIITPVVMQSLTKARNAAIKAEIDMLHMAIMNYKNEYGSFPPCFDSAPSSASVTGKHISRLFPRCANAATQIAAAFPTGVAVQITPVNAISFFLSGYTDNPVEPLSSAGLPRRKLFDFDMARVDQSTGAYYPSGKQGSPYLYYNGSMYGTANVPAYAGGSSSTPGPMRTTLVTDSPLFGNATRPFANPDTFQILCAGRDEVFGTDDDLSNFWPGTRRDYLDSLKD